MLRTICAVLMGGILLHAQEPPPNASATDTPQAGQTSPAITPAPPADSATPAPAAKASLAVEIDLAAQKAWVLQDGQRVYESPISTGRSGHETPAGNFTVLEKDPNHKSSLYGKLVDDRGRIIKSD